MQRRRGSENLRETQKEVERRRGTGMDYKKEDTEMRVKERDSKGETEKNRDSESQSKEVETGRYWPRRRF